ncbi:GA module [Mycoplasmopsis maculosa]|uniref:GA module n=1 Tax=Mycoplasmopsis maculosa TaxID=114885 RepID=A0A449B3W1_9BACT|nr:GA module-containing protein [Mycoplasmopsis maculosa]VEU75255.1 GA module [Mycoplasmopsis maculosa]
MDNKKKVIAGLLGTAAVSSATIAATLTIRCAQNGENINDHIIKEINALDKDVLSEIDNLKNSPDSYEVIYKAKDALENAKNKKKDILDIIKETKAIGKNIDEALAKLDKDIETLEKELNNNRTYNEDRAKKLIDRLSDSNKNKEELKKLLEKDPLSDDELKSIIDKSNEILDNAKKDALSEIDKLNDSELKKELLDKLNDPNVTEEALAPLKEKAKEQLDKSKQETLDEINRLSDPKKKEKLLEVIKNPNSTEAEINKAKEDAKKAIEELKKEALKELDKLNGSSNKEEFENKINADNITEDAIKEALKEASALFDKVKEDAKAKIAELTDDALKAKLLEELDKAKSINDIKLVETKVDTLKEIESITDDALKQELTNKVNEITPETENAIDKAKDLVTEAQLAKLPYPSGMQAPAVSEIRDKINAIKNNEALSEAEKEAKIKEIKDTFADLTQKINDAKEAINKLSEAKKPSLLSQLDNANLIHGEEVNTPQEFDELKAAIDSAAANDKASAATVIDNITGLTTAQKEDLKNKLKDSETDTIDEINKIIDEANVRAAKNALEDKVKAMKYPTDDTNPNDFATAIDNLLIEINSDEEGKKIDTLEKAKAFENKINEMNPVIEEIRKKLGEVTGDKTALVEQFKNADTLKKLNDTLAAVNEKIMEESIAAKKAELDAIIDALAYPNASATAKGDLKALYAGDKTLEELEVIRAKIQDGENSVESKLAEAKKKIAKLPTNKQEALNNQLNLTDTDAEFEALNQAIAQAMNETKDAKKSEIDSLTNLTDDQKDALKQEIDRADNDAEIERIKGKAELLDKIAEAKKIITPDDYALANDPEVTKIIENTIKNLNDLIEGANTQDEIAKKKAELDRLNEKLAELKRNIESLTDADVLNPEETKKELAKELAKVDNLDEASSVELEIEKAKLKKLAADLEYPGKPSADANPKVLPTAVTDIHELIDAVDTTVEDKEAVKAKLAELKKNITGKESSDLPARIAEAKAKIAEIRETAEKANREPALLAELNRANTPEEFDALLENIAFTKTSSDVEWRDKLKENLKKQAEALGYPGGSGSQAVNDIKTIINGLTDKQLEEYAETGIDALDKKIKAAKDKIAELSPSKQTELNNLLNSANTDQEFTDLDRAIKEAKNTGKNEIESKIDSLTNLTEDEKQTLKEELLNSDGTPKTNSEMNDILLKAKKDDLKKLIDTIPYPSGTSSDANRILKGEVAALNSETDLDAKKEALEKIKTAVTNANERIAALPYAPENGSAIPEGKRNLNNSLNSATTEEAINALAPSTEKDKMDKYNELINSTKNPFTAGKKAELNSLLNALPNEEKEKELKEALYNAKRNQVIAAINGLTNLSSAKKAELTNALATFTETDKNLTPNQLEAKLEELNNKILKAKREDVKAKIEALPYPGNKEDNTQDTAEVKESFTTLKDGVDTLDEAGIEAKLRDLETLKDKILELKANAEDIVNTEAEIEAFEELNKLTNPTETSAIDLAIAKGNGIDEIDKLTNLSTSQATEFKNQIKAVTSQDKIQPIIESAKLEQKRARIKNLVDTIPYPNVGQTDQNQDNTSVAASKQAIKDSLNGLSDSELDVKEAEIIRLKELMQTKKDSVPTLPYPDTNAAAKNLILNALDKVTSIDELNQVLPNDWSSKVTKYKDIITNYTNNDSSLISKLNETYPTSPSAENKDENSLKTAIFNNVKNPISEFINAATSQFTPDKKRELLQKLDAITEPIATTTQEELKNKLDALNNLLVEAKKEHYKGEINALVLPTNNLAKPNTLASDFSTSKQNLINSIVNPINNKNDFATVETKISSIKDKFTEISNLLNNSTKFNDKNNEAKNEFIKQLAKADSEDKINSLKERIEKYLNLEEIIDGIDPITNGGPDDQPRLANEGLNKLKAELRKKISTATTTEAQETYRNLLNANATLVSNLKTSLSGDILIARRLLEEASTKTNPTDLTEIATRAREIKNVIQREFWTHNNGNELRDRIRNQWLTGPSDNPRFDINNPDANINDYLTYDDLIKKLLTRTSVADVRNVIAEIPKYKKLVETKRKANEINSLIQNASDNNDPAKRAIESLKYKALTDNTASDIETTNKYLGNVVKANGQVTSGFYKDAHDTLNSIGNEANRSVLKGLLDNVATSLKDTNVKTNIDNLRVKINEFKQSYDAAKRALDQYKANPNKNDDKVIELETKLNSVTTKEGTTGADALLAEINSATTESNNKKPAEVAKAQAEIDKLDAASSVRKRLQRELDAEKAKDVVDQTVLDGIKQDVATEIAAIDTKKVRIQELLGQLPANNTVKTQEEAKVDAVKESSGYDAIISALETEKNKIDTAKAEAQAEIDKITNQDEKDRLQGLLDSAANVSDINNVKAAAELQLAKEAAIAEINKLTLVTDKKGYIDRINEATSDADINAIVEEAKLENNKERVKNLVDTIPYPNVDSSAVDTAKAHIKEAIDRITNTTDLATKETEINNIKTKMTTKITETDNLPYVTSNSPAKTKIKKGLDTIERLSDFDRVLPDDWNDKVAKYKKIVLDNFGDVSGLYTYRVDNTYPLGQAENLDEYNLQLQSFDTLKQKVISYIDDRNSKISATKKTELKNQLNALQSPTQNTTFDQFNDLINSIKAIKANAELEHKRGQILERLNGWSADNNDAKTEFKKQADNAADLSKLEGLERKIDKYAELERIITHTVSNTNYGNGGSYQDRNSVNASLISAKAEMRTKLFNNIATESAMENLRPLINKFRDLGSALSSGLGNDILLAKSLFEESKTANTTDKMQAIIDKVQPIKDAANRYWSNSTRANFANNASNRDWPTNGRFNKTRPTENTDKVVPYSDLTDKMRTRTTAAEIDAITNTEVPKLASLVNTKRKSTSDRNMPDNVKQALTNKALEANNAAEVDTINNYFGDVSRTNAQITGGYYKDAKEQIEAVPLSNRTDLQRDLDNVTTDNNGDVTGNIDKLRDKARLFKEAYNSVDTTLNNFKNSYGRTDQQVSDFERALASVTTKAQAEALKLRIENAQRDNNTKAADVQAAQNAINQLPNGNSVRTSLQTRLDNANSASGNNKADIETIKNEATTEKNKLDTAKREAKTAIESIPYPAGTRAEAIANLKQTVDQATNVADINTIKNVEVPKYITAVTEAKDEINKLKSSDPYKNELNDNLNLADTIDKINQVKNKAKTKLIINSLPDENKSALEEKLNNATNNAEIETIKREVETIIWNNNKKDVTDNFINKLKDGDRKNQIIQRLNNATTNSQLNDIKKEISQIISTEKSEILKIFDNLLKVDLTNRDIQNALKARYTGGNEITLDRIPLLVDKATTEKQLEDIKNAVNNQKEAEKTDLSRRTNGNSVSEISLMKSKLVEEIDSKVLRNENPQPKPTSGEWANYSKQDWDNAYTDQRDREKFQLYETIRNASTPEAYKAAKVKVQQFIDKYWDKTYVDTGSSWKQPIKDKISDWATRSVNRTGISSNIRSQDIENVKRKIDNAKNDRNEVNNIVKDYIKYTFFIQRRLVALKYIFNEVVTDLKTGQDRNSDYSQKIDTINNEFSSGGTISNLKTISEKLFYELETSNYWLKVRIRGMFQTDILDWWVNNIVENDTMTLDQKFEWIDKIAIITDRANALNVLRNDFIKAGFRNILNINNTNPHPDYIFPNEFITSEWREQLKV